MTHTTAAHAPTRTMQAIVRDRYGTTENLRLQDVRVPDIGDSDVLIRVHAAGLDRGAWHLMTGRPYLIRLAGYGVRTPKNPTLGLDVAGVVHAVGRHVTTLQPGDQVFGTCNGAFAEYAVSRADKLARMPDNLTFEDAAAVPVSALTALQAIRDHGRLRAGQQVLILGASGGVGSFAVQIAKALGATVTGVCSEAKVDFVRALGAEHVIDYTRTDPTRTGQRYDLVLDIAGNRAVSHLRRALTETGTLVFVGGEDGNQWTGGLGRQLRGVLTSPFLRQRLVTFISSENTKDLTTLADMLASRTIVPAIHRRCSLADVPMAMQELEQGHVRGKIVFSVAPPSSGGTPR